MRGAMPNTVASRRLTPRPLSSTAFSASTLVVPYSEIGRRGDSSVQNLPASPTP